MGKLRAVDSDRIKMPARTRRLAKAIYRSMPLRRHFFQLLRRGPTLPHALYQHLSFEGPFDVAIDPKHRFRIHSYGTEVENELFWRGFAGSWESKSLAVWDALCRSRDGLVLDIGANTGVYALAAAALGRDVIGFEPVERMAKRLRRNVELNNFSIRVEQMAVSDRTGTLPIFDDLTEHNYSASLEGQGPEALSYDVDVCALDEYLTGIGRPLIGAIKIDVERHEPAAVRGMCRTLSEQRPPILVEILDDEIGGQVRDLVDGLDYHYFHIDERRGLVRTEILRPLGDHNWNHLLCTQGQFERGGLDRLISR